MRQNLYGTPSGMFSHAYLQRSIEIVGTERILPHAVLSESRPLTIHCCVFIRLVGRYILGAPSSDHRGENEDALSPFNEAHRRETC
jgi:hypothetical protein